MQCKICSGNYKNLGVHVQKKHMPCDDYRRKFDIPLTAPLADAYLCELLSVSALQRLEDPEWIAKCTEACAANSAAINGKKRGPLNLPPVSKKRLIEMNRETGKSYRARMVPIVRVDYMAGLTPIEIKRKHGVSVQTLKDWERIGLLPRRRLKYAFEQPNVEVSGLPEAGPLERRVGLVNVAAT